MRTFSKVLLAIIFGTGSIFTFLLISLTDRSPISKLNVLPIKNTVPNSRVSSDGQDLRLKRLHDTCHKYRHLMEKSFYRKNRPLYLAAPAYKLAVCKLGKSGSTFWSRFFYILTRKGREVYKVRQLTRDQLHSQFHSNSGKDPRSYSGRLVLTVRNPYTRLFSAYIDRIFTTSSTPLVIGKNGGKCKSQISFQEFLKFVTDGLNRGEGEYHWTPLFYKCKPCEIDPTFIFKVETFTDDFSSTMNVSEIEPYKRDVLFKVLAEQTDSSISTLVDDVLDVSAPNNNNHALDCQSMKQITVRLWESLKIQGYIAESVPFPFHMYKREEDFKNSNIFRNILVETRQRYPLTKSEVTSQRLRALNRFYEKIDQDIIKGIQKIYSADFDLFGYSYDPPPW